MIGPPPPTVSFQARPLHEKRKSGLGVSCESVPVSLSMMPQQLSSMFNVWSLFQPRKHSSPTSGTIKSINLGF